ncbi:hypothetical protein A3759_02475 [Thalassolituus sp. HI0120]|nr:hypothetical protein A3759_02475 [Thalassolituus sp. HI0120]
MKNKMLGLFVLVMSLFVITAEALSVYQVNAIMTYGGQLKTDSAFVILENDTSRFEEHGAGGYSLVLSVNQNAGGSYTVETEIYADLGKGQKLLGTPAVTLEKGKPGSVVFDAELVGPVELQLTLVKHVNVDENELQECKYVECE